MIVETIAFAKRGVLYVKIPKELEKELGYKDDWFAVAGIPPDLRAYATTHTMPFEIPDKDIRETLELLKKSQIKEALEK